MRFNDELFYSYEQIIRECLIDGRKVPYYACSTSSLEDAKAAYPNFKYIGSGYTYFINGNENISKDLHHFFIEN